MRLLAISDLHLGYPANRQAVAELPPYRDDWLILAGDAGEGPTHLELALGLLVPRFARLIWVPGNHELWTLASGGATSRGEERYRELVEICRRHGALTPEDPYATWDGPGGPRLIAPLFTLYDYSFRPDEVAAEEAVAWAAESGVVCADEVYLDPTPWPSRPAWCAERCRHTEARLAAEAGGGPTVLVDHFPLRRELAQLRSIPRFSIWCGTRLTEAWPQRFGAEVVVSGHLHVRSTRHLDGVRYEEVSLGYPRQWKAERGVEGYLRQILPAPELEPRGGQ